MKLDKNNRRSGGTERPSWSRKGEIDWVQGDDGSWYAPSNNVYGLYTDCQMLEALLQTTRKERERFRDELRRLNYSEESLDDLEHR
jgi:hypothetical protein